MNVYGVIVLTTLVGVYLLDVAARLLDLRSLSGEPPEELVGLYEPEAYRRSQEYNRARRWFGLLVMTFDLALLLGFWALDGFEWWDQLARGLAEFFEPVLGRGTTALDIATGVLYLGVLGTARGLIGLPFAIWSTFVIEERFGFNKTTPRTFVLDLVKGGILSAVVGTPLLVGVLWFFMSAGSWAWLWAWAAVALVGVAVQYVVPTWVMPLFNRFEPLAEGELREGLLTYADRVQFPLREVFVIDGSKRSSKANAFFTGFGRNKRIALFDTLVEKQTTPELVAVVAHEVGHYKRKHILVGMVLSLLNLGVMFALLGVFLEHQGLFEAFGVAQPSVWVGLLLFGLLTAPLQVVLGLAFNLMSRRNEFEADRYAVETTGDAESLVSALEKLSVDHLANLRPHPLLVFLEYSHPPLLHRVRAIRQAAA